MKAPENIPLPKINTASADTHTEKGNSEAPVVQRRANATGLPDNLKTGIEQLSGYSLDDVKVHYNSAQPTQMQAHAYAQGSDIHVAPGQEKHLPHEAWHVVQQKQGRVKATAQLKGQTPVNDDAGLEKEADVMGARADSFAAKSLQRKSIEGRAVSRPVVQRALVSKDSIFIEQVKVHIVRGLALQAGVGSAKEDDTCEEFVESLQKVSIIDPNLEFDTGMTQKDFLGQERNTGLKDVNLKALQDNGLLMEAVKLAAEKSSWDEYKTDPDNKTKTKDATAEGVGAKTTKGKDIKTMIHLKQIDTKATEGKTATAQVLAADHPLGSTPSKTTKKKSAELSKSVGKAYIAGHLLNDHLGGPGNDQRNITALPKDVNTEQSDKIEETVKKIVNVEHKVAYYQVDVTYSQDTKNVGGKKYWYASALKSVFGVYKEDTDFSKIKIGDSPDANLKEKYSHVLPIQPPSSYKTGGGYVLNSNTSQYSNGGSRTPDKVLDNTGVNAAITSLNPQSDIILKDDKQVKLDFISFAISSLQIRELKDKIEVLEESIKDKDKELTEKTGEINTLKKELSDKDDILKKLETELADVKKEVEKELQEKNEQGEEMEELKKEYAELDIQYKDVEAKLKESTLKLVEMDEELKKVTLKLQETELELKDKDIKLQDKTEESRQRFEHLGYQLGKSGEDKEYEQNYFFAPPSPESYTRYEKGVKKGKEEQKPVQQDFSMDMLAGQMDGTQLGHRNGERDGTYNGESNLGTENPFVFAPLVFNRSEAYRRAYVQAYEQAYVYAYKIAFRKGIENYWKEYNYGQQDGSRLGRYRNPNNSTGYNNGYNNGLKNTGYQDGEYDAERERGKRPALPYNEIYLKAYNEGYDTGLRLKDGPYKKRK